MREAVVFAAANSFKTISKQQSIKKYIYPAFQSALFEEFPCRFILFDKNEDVI